MRRTRLSPKRDKPRRNEGRVTHKRIKPAVGATPSAEEAAHHARLREMGCLVCGAQPVSIHHVTSNGCERIARSHKLVTPLCPQHHQIIYDPKQNQSVEALGHAGFKIKYGINLLAVADRLWRERPA